MRAASGGKGPRQGRPLVMEVVGPAGAGKSTLCQLLNRHTDQVQLQDFPDVRKMKDAPFFISNCLQLVPSLFRLYRPDSRLLTRRELAWLAILRGWPFLLCREGRDDGKTIILDQGPVYLMAEVRLFGPEYLKQKDAERFWEKLYHRWETALSTIVCLDAADAILMDRIRVREQEHVVKTETADVMCDFLNKYRMEYKSLLSNFTAGWPGLRILQFDTGIQQPHVIAEQLLHELQCGETVR